MTCPNCGENLEVGDIDSRQEWRSAHYYCPGCKKEFERLTTYQTQSDLVALDELNEITI